MDEGWSTGSSLRPNVTVKAGFPIRSKGLFSRFEDIFWRRQTLSLKKGGFVFIIASKVLTPE